MNKLKTKWTMTSFNNTEGRKDSRKKKYRGSTISMRRISIEFVSWRKISNKNLTKSKKRIK